MRSEIHKNVSNKEFVIVIWWFLHRNIYIENISGERKITLQEITSASFNIWYKIN